MNRRNLAFLVTLNAVISLVIALVIVWLFEARRPDPEELAAINAPRVQPVLAATQPTDAATPVSSAPAPGTGGPVTDTVVSAPTETPAPEAEEIYFVQPGDSLLAIATRFGVTVDDIVRANNLANPDFVFAGQRLVIPVAGGFVEAESETIPAAPVDGVEITTISSPGDLANETVLIANISNAAISLQGWRLEREGGPTYTFGNVSVFPGASVRVHSGSGTDTSIDLYWGQSTALWPPGTTVRLLNPQGTTVSTLTAQ